MLPLSSLLPFNSITPPPTKTTTTTVTISSGHRRRFTFLTRHHQSSPNFKIVRNSIMQGTKSVKLVELEEAELLLATCITRTLAPALTLELGLERIKDAVEELKAKPKPSFAKAGMYRFQIAVSPGSKALRWFCGQDPSLGIFPQFFVSTCDENPTNKLLSFSRTRGVFGVGAAIYIKSPCSSASVDKISFIRYTSINSAHPMVYGLFDVTSVNYENKSFDMFIPLIELVESDGLSILTATLAWDDSSLCVYDEALNVIIYLTTALAMPVADESLNKCVGSVLRKFNMVDDKHAQMVYKDALLLSENRLEDIQLVSLLSWKMLRHRLSSPSEFPLLSASLITC